MAATSITKKHFGNMPDGTPVDLYTLSHGLVSASVTAFGARLTSVLAPDREGRPREVVLGHNSLDGFLADTKTYMGAIVGRVGNRIAGGRFSLDGQTFQVPRNDSENALHGGTIGFDRKLWTPSESVDAVTFTLISPDGDQGFPGALTVTVKYSLSAGSLRLDYAASTNKPTVVNVTNHAYFNLSGEPGASILNHELTLFADRFTPIDETLIPTGQLAPVFGTPFDFTSPTRIGERVDDGHLQIRRARGYDHNWVLGNKGFLKQTAKLRDPSSGRVLTVSSTEPGMQFYSGNFLDGTVPARDPAATVAFRSGLCLETQGYPDSPNQPAFPSITLRPSGTLSSTTIFSFSAEN